MQKTITHNDLVLAVRTNIAPPAGHLPLPRDIEHPNTLGVRQFFGGLRGRMGNAVNGFLQGVAEERTVISRAHGQKPDVGKPKIRMDFEGAVVELFPTDRGLRISTNVAAGGGISGRVRPVAVSGPRQDTLVQGLATRGVTREQLAEKLLAEADKLQVDLLQRKTQK